MKTKMLNYNEGKKVVRELNLKTKEEYEKWWDDNKPANLGDRVTIYRAMTVEEKEIGEFGISWTLKYDVAEFFKNDYQRNYSTNNLKKVIVTKEINKDQVIAFFNNRKEFEIITIL